MYKRLLVGHTYRASCGLRVFIEGFDGSHYLGNIIGSEINLFYEKTGKLINNNEQDVLNISDLTPVDFPPGKKGKPKKAAKGFLHELQKFSDAISCEVNIFLKQIEEFAQESR